MLLSKHHIYIWGCCLFVCLQSSVVFAAAALQRQMQQKQIEEQVIQQQYQQAIAQKQAQEMMRYQQAVAQKQAYQQALYQQAYQQAAYQKTLEEYQVYKYQMQQMVAQKQAEMQLAAQLKNAIAQKQAVEMAKYQQAVVYKQAVEQAVEQAQYQKAVQTIQQKQAFEMQQQAIALKQKSMINAQVNEYTAYLAKKQQLALQEAAIAKQMQTTKEDVESKMYEKAVAHQVTDRVKEQAVQIAYQQQALQKVAQDQRDVHQLTGKETLVETIADIGDVWRELDQNSLIWNQIIDREIKVLTVAEYIDRFSKMKINIKKSPGFYVQMIDEMVLQNVEMLNIPFGNVLTYVAIMEYDFDNGENKDELAKRTLGEERFLINRQRIFGK